MFPVFCHLATLNNSKKTESKNISQAKSSRDPRRVPEYTEKAENSELASVVLIECDNSTFFFFFK